MTKSRWKPLYGDGEDMKYEVSVAHFRILKISLMKFWPLFWRFSKYFFCRTTKRHILDKTTLFYCRYSFKKEVVNFNNEVFRIFFHIIYKNFVSAQIFTIFWRRYTFFLLSSKQNDWILRQFCKSLEPFMPYLSK